MILFRLMPVLMFVSLFLVWWFPLSALSVRYELIGYQAAFALLAGITLTAALILAVAGATLVLATRRQHVPSQHRALLTIIVLSVPLAVIFFFVLKANQYPMIHDITTDTTSPPQFRSVLELRPADANSIEYNSEVAKLQNQFYPDLDSMVLASSVTDTLHKIKDIVDTLGWKVISVDHSRGILEAVDQTFWFGFKDDIVIRVVAMPDGSKVDIRSTSRVGKSDLGKNADRIRQFMELLH